MERRVSSRLSGIEALLGIAATAVVLSHVARHVDAAFGAPGLLRLFQAGHAGVDLFFVISGFIILFVHRGDIAEPGRLGRYAARRFTRVLPLYWIALALTVAMSIAGGHDAPSPALMLWSAALLPTLDGPLLGVAWTLQYEVVFYAVFATLIVSRPMGAALLTGWLAVIVAATAAGGVPGMPSALYGIYGAEFFMGMAAAALLQRNLVPAPHMLACLGGGLLVSALLAESSGGLDGFGATARFVYGVPAALLVGGVAASERAGQLRVPTFLDVLGNASYSTYLFQFVFIGAVWKALIAVGLAASLPNAAVFAVLATAALAGGILTARWVEQPLLQAVRRRKVMVAEPGPGMQVG